MSKNGNAKLHEILAVEGEAEGAYKSIIVEAMHTFKSKPDHFVKTVKTYVPFNEGDPDRLATEHKEMVETVNGKLEYVWKHVVRYIDIVLQKEKTNQTATADLVLENGTVLAENVPATFLLGLETKIKQWKEMLNEIPTLAPGVMWKKDEAEGKNVYRSEFPEETKRTKKTVCHKVLYDATEKHPAQIEKWNEDVPVGKFIVNRWCSMLSTSDKSKLLARLDVLGRAVKQARQRANCAEVVKVNIGQKIVDYLMNFSEEA